MPALAHSARNFTGITVPALAASNQSPNAMNTVPLAPNAGSRVCISRFRVPKCEAAIPYNLAANREWRIEMLSYQQRVVSPCALALASPFTFRLARAARVDVRLQGTAPVPAV